MQGSYYSLRGDSRELEYVDTLTDPNASYDFHDVLILRDARDGKIWAATDSGCSCPTPFENHTFPTDFTEIRTPDALIDFVKENGDIWTRSDVDAAVEKVRNLLTKVTNVQR